jgi:hypothetical protein
VSVALVLGRALLRRRRGSIVALAVVLALGLGVAIASLEAAARTDDAFPSYLRRAQVNELVVNPSFNTDRAEQIIASTPGVLSYVSDALLTAGPASATTQAAVDDDATQVRVSDGRRYVEQDRPVVHQGRMVGHGAEAFVNDELAAARHLRVGDMLPLTFYDAGYAEIVDPGQNGAPPVLGNVDVRVVGIGVFPDEVLVDGLYPRTRVLVTPEVGARFDCLLTQPPADDARPIEELIPAMVPSLCSTSYRYFSIRVEGGDAGVGKVAAALAERFTAENDSLPAALREANLGFELTPTVTADERARVQRSLAPAVRALQLFGMAAAVSTLVLGLLGAVRIARRDEHDTRIWHELGATRGTRMAGVGLPLAVAAVAGAIGAIVVGWLASGIGPVASARQVDPGGRLGLSLGVVLVVLGASALALGAGIVVAAVAASGPGSRATPPAGARSSRAVVRAAAGNPPLTLGVRAAMAGGGGRALLGAAVAAVGAVLATVVFSASLGRLVSEPARFGWPYDVGATVNYGYGGSTDSDAIAATLDRPEVLRWGLATLSGALTIKGQTLPYVAAGPGFDDMPLPVVEGALPEAADEIALGALTASRLGLRVGSKVHVDTFYGGREATVRGIVVLPPLGPFQADRTSLGTGALLSAPFQKSVVAQAEVAGGMAPGELGDSLAGFVAIQLRPGVDPDRFLADISAQLSTWDATGYPPFTYSRPVRPATVANVAAMRTIPVALAGVLALTMALGMTLAIAVAAKARRRELAVLRALGCVGRQLRATVRWQALTVAAVGLAVGIPIGLAAGRLAYGAFAHGLGVAPDATVPLAWLAVLVVATVGVGLLAAAAPAHRAARIPAAETLRHE